MFVREFFLTHLTFLLNGDTTWQKNIETWLIPVDMGIIGIRFVPQLKQVYIHDAIASRKAIGYLSVNINVSLIVPKSKTLKPETRNIDKF